jgi:DNA-directed RNA polymerase II subunit RPB11
MSNCSDFLLLKEDHTLGNLLSAYLKMAPHVLMAGYKSASLPRCLSHPLTLFATRLTSPPKPTVGHPNVPEVLIRVQTDGTVTPREALVTVCKQLVAMYGQLGREFQKELALRQYADQGENAGAGGAGPSGQNGF